MHFGFRPEFSSITITLNYRFSLVLKVSDRKQNYICAYFIVAEPTSNDRVLIILTTGFCSFHARSVTWRHWFNANMFAHKSGVQWISYMRGLTWLVMFYCMQYGEFAQHYHERVGMILWCSCDSLIITLCSFVIIYVLPCNICNVIFYSFYLFPRIVRYSSFVNVCPYQPFIISSSLHPFNNLCVICLPLMTAL